MKGVQDQVLLSCNLLHITLNIVELRHQSPQREGYFVAKEN